MSRTVIALFMAVMSVTACDEILEKDVRKDEVIILAPSNGIQISGNSVTFWWESVTGCSHYELFIVTPDRNQPHQLVMDTLLTESKLKLDLSPGAYEWCVRGKNSAYETPYSCQIMEVVN